MLSLKTDRLSIGVFTVAMMKAALISNKHLESIINYKVPASYPMQDYKELLPYKIERFTQYPAENQWEGIIIHTEDRTIIGDMGFKGGPDEKGEMDLGYSILPAYQGKGYATEMAIAMVKWGLEQPGVRKITASCSSQNHASARVLEKAGFTKTGVQENELYWEIERLKV